MTSDSVASMPMFNKAGGVFSALALRAKKVPVKVWCLLGMAFALAWATHSMVKLVWVVIPSPELPVPQVVAATVKPRSSGPTASIDVAALQSLNIFDKFDPNADSSNSEELGMGEPQEVVQRTKLNLELQGVMASSEQSQSFAIIGKKGGDQSLYKVGDSIEGHNGVVLKEVHAIKVLLNNRGTSEELYLYGEDGTDFGVSNYTPPSRTPPRTAPTNKAPNKAVVSRDEVMQVESIGDVVRFMVATEDGKMVGYKVRPGRKRKLFDQVGLKTDDIVVSVNGIEVNEPQKVREVYQALKNATEANLDILRDGTMHSIHISMSPGD